MFKRVKFSFVFVLAVMLSVMSFSITEAKAAPSGVIKQLELESNIDIYDLSSYIRIVEQDKGERDLYKALGSFADRKSTALNDYEFNENKNVGYWFIVRIKNYDADRENWVLDFGRNISNTIGVSNLFYFYSSDDFSEKLIIDGRHVDAKRQVKGQRLNAIPLTIESHTLETLMFYIEPVRGMNFRFSPKLVDAELYPSIEYSYNNGLLLLSLLLAVFLVVALIFYFKWDNNSFLVLAFYTAISAFVYAVSDEIIPYANNAGAVVIDILMVVKIIASIILSYLILSPVKTRSTRMTMAVWGLCFIVVAALSVGDSNYGVEQYSSLIIFGYLPIIVPLFLVFKSIWGFVKTVKINSALLFGLAWLILVGEFIYDSYALDSIVSSGFDLYTYSLIAHLAVLYISSILIIDFRNKTTKTHLKHERLRVQAEDEIKRTYEIVSRNHLLEVVQRERDLLLDLKQHDSEIMQEEREEKDAKIKFLAMISHEIRTPMTGIMGLVNLLNGTTLSEKQREYVDTLHQTGNALLLMLNDILDLSKAESGKMQIEYIDFDLREIVRHVANIMEPFAHERNIQLNVGVAKSVPKILISDPSRLRQILTNLVSNAIKFTNEGYVNMIVKYDKQLEDGSHNILFVVEDTGIGIAEEQQEHLFQPYVQAGSSVSRKFGGTGLGLAICYQLVTSMGGEIDLNSVEDRGSTFYFNLPMEEGIDPDAEEEDEEEAAAAVTDDNKVNILLVDDHNANRKIMAMQMKQKLGKRMGELKTAANGMEAINLVEKNKFNVIFMDLEMPDFSGIAVTDMIRKMSDREKAKTPIIAMTAHKDDDVIATCIQSGMNDFIDKPLDLDKLGAIISNIADKDKLDSEQLGAGLGSELRNENVPQMSEEERRKRKIDIGDPNELGISNPEDNLDEELLSGIRDSLPADEFNKLMHELCESMEKEIKLMDKAVDKSDIEKIKFHSHTIYGAAENFGFNALGYIARKVYKHAKNNDEIEVISKYTKEVSSTYKETLKEALEFISNN